MLINNNNLNAIFFFFALFRPTLTEILKIGPSVTLSYSYLFAIDQND